jgi:hypothetical protein
MHDAARGETVYRQREACQAKGQYGSFRPQDGYAS